MILNTGPVQSNLRCPHRRIIDQPLPMRRVCTHVILATGLHQVLTQAMAPKRGRGGRPAPAAAADGAADAADAAASLSRVPPVTPTEVVHFNSELLHTVQKLRASIEGHPLFENNHANDPY